MAVMTWTIASMFRGQALMVMADPAHGGIVSSINWDGFEFLLPVADGGASMQTAVEFNNLGEALNPTQGGSAYDAPYTSSTRILTEYTSDPNMLTMAQQMAYWFPVSGQFLSDTYVTSFVGVGLHGVSNLIHDHITVSTTGHYFDGGLEVLTLFAPATLSHVMSLDPRTMAYSELALQGHNAAWANGAGHQAIVLATPDGAHALAIWGKDTAQYVADWRDNPVNSGIKIDAWTDWQSPSPEHAETHDVFVAVGNLSDVAAAIHAAWGLP